MHAVIFSLLKFIYILLLKEMFVQVQSILVKDMGVPASLTLGLDTDDEKAPEVAEPQDKGVRFLNHCVDGSHSMATNTCLRLLGEWEVNFYFAQVILPWGFPGGASGKEPACQWRRCKRHGFGKNPWRRKWQPLKYSCLENPTDRETWQATVHGVAKSRTRLRQLSRQSLPTLSDAEPGV